MIMKKKKAKVNGFYSIFMFFFGSCYLKSQT